MERAREARDREQAEAEVAGVGAAAGVRAGARAKAVEWDEAAGLQQDRAGIAFAPTVVKGPPINWAALAISSNVRSAARS